MYSFFANFLQQLKTFWLDLKLSQKTAFAAILGLLILLGTVVLIMSNSMNYVMLYSPERMQSIDIAQIKAYFESANIPYKISENKGIWIPKEKEHQVRAELAFNGLPKTQTKKGFELFDSSTWIKGEKELQVLELRALKGQLENDISQFENVRSANVILDVPPPRPFGAANYKAKASVILSLKPGARLNSQELRAITFHVAGAVRGLTGNMVAISDTNGHLYQAIDPEGGLDSIRNAELSAEGYLKAKIDGMLTTVVGAGNFYSTVQVTMNRNKISEERKVYTGSVDGVSLGSSVVTSISETGEQPIKAKEQSKSSEQNGGNPSSQNQPELFATQQFRQMAVPVDHVKITSVPGKIDALSIGVLIDDQIFAPAKGVEQNENQIASNEEKLKKNIESQLEVILKGYTAHVSQSVNFIKFDRTPIPPPPVMIEAISPGSENNSITTALVAIITLGVFGIFYMMFRVQQHSKRVSVLKAAEEGTKKKRLEDLEGVLEAIKAQLEDRPNILSKNDGKTGHSDEPLSIKQILTEGEPSKIAAFLGQESPQTIALILYSLPQERASVVLNRMPIDLQAHVLVEMAQFDETDPNQIELLLGSLPGILGGTSLEYGLKMAESFKVAASIFNSLPERHQRVIIEKIKMFNPEISHKFHHAMQEVQGEAP